MNSLARRPIVALFAASLVMFALVAIVAPDALAAELVAAWEWIKMTGWRVIDTVVWWLGLPGIEHDPAVLVSE